MTSNPKFHDQIGLFPNEHKRSPNDPAFRGSVVLTKELIKQLVSQIKAGLEPKLSCAAWVNDYNGGKRVNVKLQAWDYNRQQSAPQQQQQAQSFQQPEQDAFSNQQNADFGNYEKQNDFDDDLPF